MRESREWEEIKGGNCREEMRGGRESERIRERKRERKHVAKKLEDTYKARYERPREKPLKGKRRHFV